MNNKIVFALGFHNHQPIGNFPEVFESAYQDAYLPFLEVVSEFPEIRISLHCSGILWDWIEEKHPEYMDKLKELVNRNQVEMMAGGYYEPILSIIPDSDKIGQIRMMRNYLSNKFGSDATGLWLTERVWEPHLAGSLNEAGIKYTIVDDTHFRYTGLTDEDMMGYFITEEQGSPLAVFPISKALRYMIPFQDPEVSVDYMISVASEDPNRVIVMADDGEKFGVWPGTHKLCYERGWLRRFFTCIRERSDTIEMLTFSEILASRKPIGRVYLPTASYVEMSEWAMPAKAIREYEDLKHRLEHENTYDTYGTYVRGGFWRNFLVKYDESNIIQKKMLRVSRKVAAIPQSADDLQRHEAVKNLYLGECNCAYWHGIFGGLYLPHLRTALFKHLIMAETIADELINFGSEDRINVEETDFDLDGYNEILIEMKGQNLYFRPFRGASLFEWDLKKKAFNLQDTLTRREEAYHKTILKHKGQSSSGGGSIHDQISFKESGLDKKLRYDKYDKRSLVDHFLDSSCSIKNLESNDIPEVGDWVEAEYDVAIDQKDSEVILEFAREGFVATPSDKVRTKLTKKVTIDRSKTGMKIEYSLMNLGNSRYEAYFSPEINFTLLAGDADDRYYYLPDQDTDKRKLRSTGEYSGVRSFGMNDDWQGIKIRFDFDTETDIWHCPIETVSQSEGGFESIYQGSTIMPHWLIKLAPGEIWKTGMTITADEIIW